MGVARALWICVGLDSSAARSGCERLRSTDWTGGPTDCIGGPPEGWCWTDRDRLLWMPGAVISVDTEAPAAPGTLRYVPVEARRGAARGSMGLLFRMEEYWSRVEALRKTEDLGLRRTSRSTGMWLKRMKSVLLTLQVSMKGPVSCRM